jgi:Ca2+-binding EF-hand superfamily protein
MSTNKKKLGLAAVLVTLVTGGVLGVASADNGGASADRDARKAEILQRFDTNHDGVLDAGEKQAMHAAMKAKREEKKQELLAKYDTNKDGTLDEQERQAMRDDLIAQRFAKLDTDGDGTLSLAEFKAGMEQRGFGMGGFGHHHGGHRFGRRGPGAPRAK